MRPTFTLAALSLALAATTAGAQAPTPAATGTQVVGGLDQRWEVACTVLAPALASTLGLQRCTGVFAEAALVTSNVSGWTLPMPSPGGMQWISVLDDATLGNVSGGENPVYEYTFRTRFDVPVDVDPAALQLDLSAFRFDNYWVGYRVNQMGAFVPGSITPPPMPPNGGNWETPFVVTGLQSGSGAFVQGTNTLELRISGNGITDGLAASFSGQLVQVVPEPATWTLLAAGVGMLGAVARRRRSA